MIVRIRCALLVARGAVVFRSLVPISAPTADRHHPDSRGGVTLPAVGRGDRLPLQRRRVSVIQSGSVRMYGQRPTVRWDKLEPERLDATLDGLRAAGYAPYLLLESWEDPLFRARFTGTRALSDASRSPVIEYYGPISVRVLRLDDEAHCGDRRVLPQAVPAP